VTFKGQIFLHLSCEFGVIPTSGLYDIQFTNFWNTITHSYTARNRMHLTANNWQRHKNITG